MRIHWLCIRICIQLKFVFQFINVVLCHNKSDKLLSVLILWYRFEKKINIINLSELFL